ncbi:MAG: hypothetical protein KDA53_12840 [Hyphomonas sp.]|nr:hypothetical protein [Hyphomonas sp.]
MITHLKSVAIAAVGGALFLSGAALAESFSGPDEAVDYITTVTETQSKPFYNGSYYKIEISAPDTCTLVKTTSDYSEENELKKTVVTTYDVGLIDPAKVQVDHIGGVKFWSVGEATVFPMETTMGGNFNAMLPGDNFTVRDEAAESGLLADALKYLAGHCAG